MIKLELDWASEGGPDTGLVSNDGDDVIVIVEYDAKPGPSGHPTVAVYATRAYPSVEAYRETMELDAWLETAYGMSEEDERQDLLNLAIDV